MTIPRDTGLRLGPYFDRNLLLGTIDYILKILLPYREIMTGVIELNAPLSLIDWEQKAIMITTEVHSTLDEIEKELAAANLSSESD